jgi:hypothetical protein
MEAILVSESIITLKTTCINNAGLFMLLKINKEKVDQIIMKIGIEKSLGAIACSSQSFIIIPCCLCSIKAKK